MFGAIEAGGTKMVCGIVSENGDVVERKTFPTKDPEDTIPVMVEYFKDKNIKALGIGCFGPLDLNPKSKTYGYITSTPKKGWNYFDIKSALESKLEIPVGLDTDVNAAILGEVIYGAAEGCSNAIYITIGTGVGVGVYVNDSLMHGLIHPEAGHMLIKKKDDDKFLGVCPYHNNCVEGLVSGPSIAKRWGKPAIELEEVDEVWELESFYLAEAITNYILAYSPEKIVLWGGVMHQDKLWKLTREKVKNILNGYVQSEWITDKIDQYIVAPKLGENAGLIGAACLGRKALNNE